MQKIINGCGDFCNLEPQNVIEFMVYTGVMNPTNISSDYNAIYYVLTNCETICTYNTLIPLLFANSTVLL